MTEPLPDLDTDLVFAGVLADAAREAVTELFRSDIDTDNKSRTGFDPVTRADRAIEARLRDLIHARYPNDGVMGEEGLDVPSSNGRTWVIDPIDGTRAFIAGLPTWCVLVALTGPDGPVLSVIDQPFTGERFRGLCAPDRLEADLTHAGVTRPLRSRQTSTLATAILTTTDPFLFEGGEAAAFSDLRGSVRLCRFGLDAYGYAALALGGVDLVVESGLRPWDIAALVPVVRGSGGLITDWQGADRFDSGQVLAAANATVHAEALARLRPYAR